SCRDQPRRAANRHPLDRRPVSRHQLCQGPRPRPAIGTKARQGRHPVRRPGGDTGLEHVAHLEAWYGIMGIGAIYHTVNPRLFPDQIAWIVNHAEDRVMLADLTFIPLLEKLADKLPTIERYVVLTDSGHMPQTSLKNAIAYEEWIGEVDGDFAWKKFDENTASGMCYTSGTPGNPKGLVYSHRSNVLHGLMANTSDMKGYSSRDVVMPVVPMFHANCWAMMFAAPIAGASMVMPGAKLDGASVFELLDRYKVTCTAAVPTVWL